MPLPNNFKAQVLQLLDATKAMPRNTKNAVGILAIQTLTLEDLLQLDPDCSNAEIGVLLMQRYAVYERRMRGRRGTTKYQCQVMVRSFIARIMAFLLEEPDDMVKRLKEVRVKEDEGPVRRFRIDERPA